MHVAAQCKEIFGKTVSVAKSVGAITRHARPNAEGEPI